MAEELSRPEEHPAYIDAMTELEAANIALMAAQARQIAAVINRHNVYLELNGDHA